MFTHSSRGLLLALATLMAWPLLGSLSYAQDKDARMEELLQQVRKLSTRVEELEDEREDRGSRLEDRINALTAGLGTASTNDFNSHWKGGLRFDNGDKSFRLHIGGRIQNDWAWGTQDKDYEQNPAAGHFEDGTLFRRTHLQIDGQIHEHVIFKTEFNFAGGDADFFDVWIGLKNIGFVERIRVGHFKHFYSLEKLTSNGHTTFMERSLADVFAPGRETGLGINGTALEQNLTWGISVFREVDSYGDSAPADDGAYGVSARVTWIPWYCDQCDGLLHLGGGIVYEGASNDAIRFRQRPEISISPTIFDTGSIEADSILRLNLELAFVWGAFSFQSEYFYIEIEGTNGNPDPAFWGAYAYVSFFLTGEQRPYNRKHGVFGRAAPHENFLEGDGWGAWEVAARASYLDLNDDDVNAGKAFNITIALNWYLNPHTMIKLNYIYTNLDEFAPNEVNDGEAHIVGMRFQIDF
ncbi:MAG: porin [Planctomycetota bacterium]